MLEKCVLTILELNWNQRLGHKKSKLNICHYMLTSSTQLQSRSFHVVERTRTSSKCQKMKNARAKRAKILFLIVKYANLWGFCCRRCRGCLAPYCDDNATHKRRSFLLCLYVKNHPFQSIERTLSRFLTTWPTRNNREFKIYDATAATTPQILHI